MEMSLAFAESNTRVDATRIQRLEEQFDDLSNKVEHMQGKLCTCGGKVRVFLLSLGARGDVLTQYIASTLQVLGLKN